MKNTQGRYGLAVVLSALALLWLYLRFPIYDEEQVKNLIEHNIPRGASRTRVVQFLNTLEWKDVEHYSKPGKEAVAFFPSTIYMRGWWHIKVFFTFKDDRLIGYNIKHIKI